MVVVEPDPAVVVVVRGGDVVVGGGAVVGVGAGGLVVAGLPDAVGAPPAGDPMTVVGLCGVLVEDVVVGAGPNVSGPGGAVIELVKSKGCSES